MHVSMCVLYLPKNLVNSTNLYPKFKPKIGWTLQSFYRVVKHNMFIALCGLAK